MYDHTRLFTRLCAALSEAPGSTLRQLARGLRVHPHTLTRVVRERTGSSFSVWRAHRRASAACRLLRTRPELSIKEIGAAAGFSATSVFDRFLRRACGRSPSECRRASPADGAGISEMLCGDSVAPLGRSAVRRGAKVNVLVGASTIERVHDPPADATLEGVRRVIPTETSRSPT